MLADTHCRSFATQFQPQSDGSALRRCESDGSDANRLIIARDLLTVSVARQLGGKATKRTAVAPGNPVRFGGIAGGNTFKSPRCGINERSSSSSSSSATKDGFRLWMEHFILCSCTVTSALFLFFQSLGKDILARQGLKLGQN